jgi:DNA replication and repair protein RecF
VRVQQLWLDDFRSYRSAAVTFAPGLTAVVGANGEGKTNLLEALAWLATMSSFRGAPAEALIRHGGGPAVVRAEIDHDGRTTLVEAELGSAGRNRVQVNRQRLHRARDLLGALRVTVFTPDDLELVKGGPSQRRRFLDDCLVALHPRYDTLAREVDRVLRQRNALLRQVGGRLDESAAFTLDVWDAKLAEAGEALARARGELLDRLVPVVTAAYRGLAGEDARVEAGYETSWARHADLAGALAASRRDDVRRGVTTVGPHRDEVVLTLDDLPARTHASQGEQRSLALALRLGAHHVVTDETGAPPVLLLDDVFSELDAARSDALLRHLPSGQTVLTTAGTLPPGTHPELVLRVAGGEITVGDP